MWYFTCINFKNMCAQYYSLLNKKIMANVIAERTQAGTPVVMVINSNNTISVLSKKQTGRKHDTSHDVEEFYETDPLLGAALKEISSPYEPMASWIASFIAQMWEECAELDPWYIVEDEDLDS